MSFSRKRKRVLAAMLLSALLLSACGSAAQQEEEALYAPPAVPMVVTPAPTETPPPTPEPDRAALRISEAMAKNHATLRDEDGDFSDWIEIENTGDTAIDLTGFRLTDKLGRPGLALSGSIEPGELRLFWASGKDRPEGGHGSFSLSSDETVSLIDPYGRVLSAVSFPSDRSDCSVAVDESGDYAETEYPTPGFPNTKASYDALQAELPDPSPLQINEVCVFNTGAVAEWRLKDSGKC